MAGPWDGRDGAALAAAWSVPGVETYTSLGSTNDRAAELADQGAPAGTVVVAEEQTAGRGRRGSAWRSAPGVGLWLSVVLPPDRAAPELPLVVGLACAEAVEEVMGGGGPDIRVKWPNDLLLADRKVGGILCEASPRGVVVGVGINVGAPTEGFGAALAPHVTILQEHVATPLDRTILARHVLRRILHRTEDPAGFGESLAELRSRDALRDRRVVTEQAGPGVARGIDEHGALVLEREDGRRVRITAGSVRLGDGTDVP